ncbi:MAG: CapA family protein [Bacteroidales bacterium]|jgi:poly-gamma-glutamate synthesis protein (capsule biosynthesis protein)|nr:CapA family protein [Bacteroidales bacterium]
MKTKDGFFKDFILILFPILMMTSCSSHSDEELKILIGGDVMLDRGIGRVIDNYGVSFLFNGIREDLKSADASIINLECPLTDTLIPQHKKYQFRASPVFADSLLKNGVTHACLENNHTHDQGELGYKQTLESLSRAGIISVSSNPFSPTKIEKGDNRIALFNANLLGNSQYVSYWQSQLSKAIEEYKRSDKKAKAVVILHWGDEYEPIHSQKQENIAKLLVGAGADVIVGHHPHVVQDTMRLGNCPVYYSLGNLIFDHNKMARHKSSLLEISLKNGKLKTSLHELRISNYRPMHNSSDQPRYNQQP